MTIYKMIAYFGRRALNPIFYIGLVVVLKNVLFGIYWLLNYLKAKLFLKDLKSYGNTIVITGCTDGIGKSLTYALAKQNVNLLLISRNEKELKNIKKDLLEINKNSQRTIDYIVFDYNEHKFSSYKSMQDKLQKIDIGILINNVGISYPNPLYFHEMETELIEQLVNVNLMSAYFMTRLVLPTMIKKRKGLILYTSSGVTALQTSPLYTVYASVKDGVCSFANSLNVELKEYNIQVQCHIPMFITTKLSKIKKSSLFVPTPEMYSECVIQKMKEGNILPYNVISSPYFFHKIQIFFYNFFPKWLFSIVSLASLKVVRQKALKKMKKEE
ncbi:steroid dehydrogenase, putative [Plasmodium vinckei brucechwatti]|uniref:Steroid dehydrogenase, putative n=1 Tax=Plasmodium vinckei brucechwatti TaxID=119398 RepID=A0A6V7RXB0_PLAVN|nr:steroid dehydrogenase, putative [Plasmodium vinckei brucechwatti]